MSKSFIIKTSLVIVIVVMSLLLLVPSLSKTLPPWWPSFFSEKIRLGLDLQGGMHLVLEVDTEKALLSRIERASQELLYKIREEKKRLSCSDPEVDANKNIIINYLVEDERSRIEDLMRKNLPDFIIEYSHFSKSQGIIISKLRDEAVKHICEQAATQALETIRNRVDQFGVTEPEIVPQSGGRILIQLPGIKDTQRAVAIIGKTAQLEFRLVDDTVDPHLAMTDKTVLSIGSELNYIYSRERFTGRVSKEPIIIRSRASMTGENIADARMHIESQNGEPFVSVIFNEIGKRYFADLTSRNVKKRLAIMLDGKVQSAPVIQEPIIGGEARISGDFTMEEARDLAVMLRSGALPAPVKILEERTVGPSLGRDSINQGLLAALIGGLSVFLFMLIYYKLSGLAADVAVILNIVIIMAVMVIMQATLTLPGIAGIILMIGIAVDANVLINERIREELRQGKSPAAAVEAGYSRAIVTIFDANLTTAIAALVLYQFGTGPIKGFAVTLLIGLASSMFTAIVVTRLMFDYILVKYRPKRLSI